MQCLEQLNAFKLAAPWQETLSTTSALPPLDSVHDDIKRESCFYQLALQNTIKMRRQILAANIKFTRPDDYFAEMLKTDAHMEKVREKLLAEAQGMKNSEEAKKQRQLKKFGKQVQQQKLLDRQASKSGELEKIKMARKKQNNADKGDEFGIEVEEQIQTGKRKRADGGGEYAKKQRGNDASVSYRKQTSASKPNASRQHRNEKYGFGGAKRNIKSNTKESTNNMEGFSVKKMKSGSKPSKKATGGKKSTNRPGKEKRGNMRNRT